MKKEREGTLFDGVRTIRQERTAQHEHTYENVRTEQSTKLIATIDCKQ
jgi:hypothetical protein